MGRYEEALPVRREALHMVEEVSASGPVDTNLRLALALGSQTTGTHTCIGPSGTRKRSPAYEKALGDRKD